jgi:hypothetical protein
MLFDHQIFFEIFRELIVTTFNLETECGAGERDRLGGRSDSGK